MAPLRRLVRLLLDDGTVIPAGLYRVDVSPSTGQAGMAAPGRGVAGDGRSRDRGLLRRSFDPIDLGAGCSSPGHGTALRGSGWAPIRWPCDGLNWTRR